MGNNYDEWKLATPPENTPRCEKCDKHSNNLVDYYGQELCGTCIIKEKEDEMLNNDRNNE